MFRPTLFALAIGVAAVPAAPSFAQAAGQVTSVPRAQIIANSETEFARVDANKDGKMSRAEIENFQRSSTMAMMTARNKALFAQLDGDKNGQLSAAEFATAIPAPKVDASSVLRIDSNKDGQVSLAEHRAATLTTFTKIDTNKDGSITAVEVEAAAKQ